MWKLCLFLLLRGFVLDRFFMQWTFSDGLKVKRKLKWKSAVPVSLRVINSCADNLSVYQTWKKLHDATFVSTTVCFNKWKEFISQKDVKPFWIAYNYRKFLSVKYWIVPQSPIKIDEARKCVKTLQSTVNCFDYGYFNNQVLNVGNVFSLS